MIRLTTSVAALALCLAVPMLAQTTAPAGSAPTSQDQSMPSTGAPTAPSTSPSTAPSTQTSPTQGQTTATDLTGQTIYTSKGRKIGKVSAMSTDAHGQQAAAVRVERYLGMGGQTVLIPVSSLQARDNGGYTTSLSSTEIKSLATSGSNSTTTP